MIHHFQPSLSEIEQLRQRATSVKKENFVSFIEELASHDSAVSSHKQWEKVDQEWKDITKSTESHPNPEVERYASMVRVAYEEKQKVHDIFAQLADIASESVGVIEEYSGEHLGIATKFDEVPELSVEWHNNRRYGVGGSSLSSSLGFHWKSYAGSPAFLSRDELNKLWISMMREKTTVKKSTVIPTEGVLYRGHMWEPALIARYSLINDKRVAVSKATWKGSLDVQIINFDGIILDDDGNPEGILECKTSSREWTWQWGVPINYRAQVLWYLHSTGLKYADVIVKFDSGVFDTYRIYSDETIDGTEATYPLEKYIPTIEKRWAQHKNTRENPAILWDYDDVLIDEIDNQVFGIADADAPVEEILGRLNKASIVNITFTSPYERMDDIYKKVDVAYIKSNGESSSMFSDVSPVFYPIKRDGASTYSEKEISSQLLGISGDMIAIDDKTYQFLISIGKSSSCVVNASAIRRILALSPREDDFSTIEEAEEFLSGLTADGVIQSFDNNGF